MLNYYSTFKNSDPRYIEIMNLTLNDLDAAMEEITSTQIEASNLIYHIYSTRRTKRSILPFGGLFKFLFGTADNNDIDDMKQDIQRLYDNQVDQANILNDVVSITNISRGLINENILKINEIINTITFLNDSIDDLYARLRPLYNSRRFQLLHSETQTHHLRIRTLIRQIHSGYRPNQRIP